MIGWVRSDQLMLVASAGPLKAAFINRTALVSLINKKNGGGKQRLWASACIIILARLFSMLFYVHSQESTLCLCFQFRPPTGAWLAKPN